MFPYSYSCKGGSGVEVEPVLERACDILVNSLLALLPAAGVHVRKLNAFPANARISYHG